MTFSKKYNKNDNTGELVRLYAKWNKLDKNRQILYDLIYMGNLKKKNRATFIVTENSEPDDDYPETRMWGKEDRITEK